MREQDDLELAEIIDSLGADKAFEIKVIRKKPLQWGNPPVNIAGTLETFDELINEAEIEELFGGGTYSLQVMRPNGKGSMVYFKSVTVKIPGKPHGKGIEDDRDEDRFDPRDFAPQEDTTLAGQAMITMQKLLADQTENAKRSGMDPLLIQTIMAPLQTQLAATHEALRDVQSRADNKDERIMTMMNTKPETSGVEMLMGRMFDSQGQRQDAMRAAHESELRMMRENHRDDMKRADDRHVSELRSRDDAHRRELDNLQRAMDMMKQSSDLGHQAINKSMELENQRLRDDLTVLKAEVVTLRAKKEKTLIEQASELHQVGEQLSNLGLGFGKEEDSEPHWVEKLGNMVIDNPEVIANVASSVGIGQQQHVSQPGAVPGQHQIPEQAESAATPTRVEDIPLWQPFRANDGEVYVKVPPDGSIVTYEQAVTMRDAWEAKEAKEAEEKKAEQEEADRVARGEPTPVQVKLAITFAEGAFSNGTPPETFAQSARSSVPGHLLDYINKVGVDTFLNEVANLAQESPLRTQAGRNYMRQVAQFLLGGESG
jgi:hypothetical protein